MAGSAAESDPLCFKSSSGPSQGKHFQNRSGNQLGSDHPQPQQIEAVQNLPEQCSVPHNQQQQQQIRGGLGNVGNVGPVKLEPHMGPADQNGPTQRVQTSRSIAALNMEPQQLQPLRNSGPVKMEPQHSDASMFLQQQQQKQYLLLRQSSQAAAAQMTLLQQQRMLQQQQQQLLKNLPQQRSQLQQQLNQQGLPVRP